MARPAPRPHDDAAAVATKAFLRAAAALSLSQAQLATLLGVSPASLSRMAAGQRMVQLGTREGDFALFVLRIFRSLDPLVGGDDAKARRWLTSENLHLGGVPLDLMQRIDGIVHVAEYLDAMRAKV